MGDFAGDVLCAGVDGVEGFEGVEVVVDPGSEDGVEGAFEGMKVDNQCILIEGIRGDGEGDAEVVAVDGFDDAGDLEGVCGAELTFNRDFEHQRVYRGWRSIRSRTVSVQDGRKSGWFYRAWVQRRRSCDDV